MTTRTGTCRHCQRRREALGTAQHKGGRTDRNRPRWYWSSICAECATELLGYCTATQLARGTGSTVGWSVRSLLHMLECAGQPYTPPSDHVADFAPVPVTTKETQ